MHFSHLDETKIDLRGKVILLFLNGPPRCGKDTAGRYITEHYLDTAPMKLSGPIKRSVHADLNFPPELPDDAFEEVKDTPLDAFFGMTPRQAYIRKSEEIMKPLYGKDIYGRLAALRTLPRLYMAGKRLIPITDSGFDYEAKPLIDAVGEDNCYLIRIHAEERGCSFVGDSRSYIELPNVRTIDLFNNGPKAELLAFGKHVTNVVQEFIALKRPCILRR